MPRPQDESKLGGRQGVLCAYAGVQGAEGWPSDSCPEVRAGENSQAVMRSLKVTTSKKSHMLSQLKLTKNPTKDVL